MNPLSHTALYRRWVWANGWAELLGLGSTLLLGWFGARAFSPADASLVIVLSGTFAAIVFGTLLEGVLIGFAQAQVLHDRLATLTPRSWILATASGAATANTERTQENQHHEELVCVTQMVIAERRGNLLFSL